MNRFLKFLALALILDAILFFTASVTLGLGIAAVWSGVCIAGAVFVCAALARVNASNVTHARSQALRDDLRHEYEVSANMLDDARRTITVWRQPGKKMDTYVECIQTEDGLCHYYTWQEPARPTGRDAVRQWGKGVEEAELTRDRLDRKLSVDHVAKWDSLISPCAVCGKVIQKHGLEDHPFEEIEELEID